MNVINFIVNINNNDVDMKYIYALESSIYKDDKVYGIKIEREDTKDGKVIGKIEDKVSIISKNKELVESLLNLLYNNQVSPIHLVDIIGETVDNCVSEFK